MTPLHVPALTGDELAELHARGFLIKSNVFSDAYVDALEKLGDEAVAHRNYNFELYDDLFKRISTKDGFVFVNELSDDSCARGRLSEMCLTSQVRDVARALIGERAAHCCYQLVYKYPNHERAFAWHQDEVQTPADPPFFNMWIALSDMNEANGCLWAMPKIGLDRLLPHEDTPFGRSAWPLDHENQGVPLTMKRGDCCIMSSKTLHKSGPNQGATVRKAMLIIFMDRQARIHGTTVPTIAYPE